MRLFGVVAVASVLILAGCGSAGDGSTHTTATAVAAPAADHEVKRLVCDESIDRARPGAAGFQVVLGVVALPTAPRYEALQTARTGMHGRLRLFAKTGLLIKPRTRFELVVPAGLRRRMALFWGNANEGAPSSRLVVDDCGRGLPTGSKWLVYAGGYYVSHPACAPVDVVAGGHRRRVAIGVGAPCPGQRPPQRPTQD